jgi:nucleotidyltransferase substrate binding protein (TIGR01987 family)
MPLDLSPLERAIAQLRKSLAYGRSELARRDPELALQFRAAAIQAFEYTYELSWKMLKRHLESVVANPAEVDAWSFADLIRSGNEHGLLRSDWPVWRDYRKARGTTSHTYDDSRAREVFEILPDFLEEASILLERLHERVSRA